MKAISKQQHNAVISALEQLRNLHKQGLLPADGFSLPIQNLNQHFAHYESLLSQLATSIDEYEALQKEVNVNVVAPALRQARKQQERKNKEVTNKHLFY